MKPPDGMICIFSMFSGQCVSMLFLLSVLRACKCTSEKILHVVEAVNDGDFNGLELSEVGRKRSCALVTL